MVKKTLQEIKLIHRFDELIDIAKQAKVNRLDAKTYRKITFPVVEKSMCGLHLGKATLKGFLVRFPLMRRIRFLSQNIKGGGSARSDALINDFLANVEEYRKSHNLLFDEWSKKVFLNILAGEMLMDVRFGIHFQQSKIGKMEYYCVNIPIYGNGGGRNLLLTKEKSL